MGVNMFEKMIGFVRFSFFILLFLSVPVRAEENENTTNSEAQVNLAGVPLTGRIFADFFVPTTDAINSRWQQSSVSFWLEADPKLGSRSSAHIVFTGDEIQASSVLGMRGQPYFRTNLREGYIVMTQEGWELKGGKMIIPWGKSDVVNPTDFLTAKDYTFFNPDEEVRRIGAVGVSLSWTPQNGNSPLTLTTVLNPVFAQSRLLLAPQMVPSQVSLSSSPQIPEPIVSNTEMALKVSYVGTMWDSSISLYRGFNHLPDLQITGIGGTPVSPTITVAETYHQMRALGVDGSASLGKWVFRGESAYFWTENNDGSNPLIQPSHWDGVLGVERPLGEDFRIQAQTIFRYFPFYSSPSTASGATPFMTAVNQQLAAANALIQNYQDRFRPALTFRFAYSNDQNRISTEMFLLMNIVGGDYIARPQFSYSWTDALKSTLGLNYYAGPIDRPLGALAPYNAVFAELKYVF